MTGVMRRLRDEGGQSIVEWLGGTVVMVVIVLAVFAIEPSLGERLRCQVAGQIDRVLTIDASGGCDREELERRRFAQPRPRPTARDRQAAQDRLDRDALLRPGR